MAFPSEEELCDRIKHFERSLLNVMTQGTEADLTTLSRELQDLTEIISKATLEDNPPYTADLFACSKELANRVILVASYMQRIAHLADAAEKNLETKLTTVFNSSTRPSSQRSNLKGATSHSNDEFAALRRWFLEHIDNPYPDRSQKSQLQHELGLSLQSITQFFTNARRRSGWMDFVKKYRDGSVEDTAVLIRAIENQEGTDGTSAIDIPSGACDALTKIREYLSAGLEPEIRDGLEEALNMELKRIAEDKAKLLEQGAVLSDGLLPKRKKAKTTTTLDKPGTTMAPATDIITRSVDLQSNKRLVIHSNSG
ncbi:hypothetical protein CALVIDRAFT_564267 [Calocera viscosa TUFC12733]|uniref:Homeobox domain-containing protein n=1 Tax=Calocera viscosa (strain TUFC12733) TaxID=1330018 RepID=A0A167LSM5_CALVF|nr:hypothetical protein CALVIDRAFT_564267 [Calocera viscosa TUFC12733]